jgi:hypothetical protein
VFQVVILCLLHDTVKGIHYTSNIHSVIRQALNVQRNFEARSPNQFQSHKAVSIKYYKCVSVCKSHLICAVLYCHLWPVWLYQVSPHYFTDGTIFKKKKKKLLRSIKKCFDFLYIFS